MSLSIDPNIGKLKHLSDFSLMDIESVHLILTGNSVIDWQRLHLSDVAAARAALTANEFHPDETSDRTRLERIKNDAIAFLRRQFEFPIPKPVEESSVEELLLLASGKGHRQLCACIILKAMHIIHHVEGRELLHAIPLADQELFHLVEEKVYRVIGGMLSTGFPITEFTGGRKNSDSLYSKLLSKRETTAAAIYDKLRFRIVTRSKDDVIPVLLYLSEHLFPYNYVVPGQSVNTIFHFKRYFESEPHLKPMLKSLQGITNDLILSGNTFSDEQYRVIQFVVDLPVRLPKAVMELAPPSAWSLGAVVFVLCEFQIIDRETESSNERGNASHAKYKDRQKQAVMRRLKLGFEPSSLRTSMRPNPKRKS